MGTGKLQLVSSPASAQRAKPTPKDHARQKHEQVAAVCYRTANHAIDFLLVHTRKGRWTFPKGGIKAGTMRAQSAALEAFEEAGVHGRIEEAAFAQYTLRKGGRLGTDVAVHAYLCEVLWLESPQESNRYPEWFSPQDAKRRLREGRNTDNGAELAGVIDRATTRIRRSHHRNGKGNDAMQQVAFEASEVARLNGQIEQVAFVRYMRRERNEAGRPSLLEFALKGHGAKVPRLGPPESES